MSIEMLFFPSSSVEAPTKASRQNQQLLTSNWCVPGGVKMADDGGSTPVGRTKELIAFRILCVMVQGHDVFCFLSKSCL
jgi:hypothetical protein